MKINQIAPWRQMNSRIGLRQPHSRGQRHAAWFPGLVLLLGIVLSASAGEPDKFDFKVLAQLNTSTFGSIKTSPNLALSFNDQGQAAFTVSLVPSGEGIFVADGPSLRKNTP